jgi:hypothetical protein
MSYFTEFPKVDYVFGQEASTTTFQDLSVYADIIDQVKDAVSLYEDYYVLPDERPDQVSYKLYGTTENYWTFFLINEKLRESGWPLGPGRVFDHAKKIYSDYILNTRTVLTDKFKVGQTITGLSSGATAKIKHRELDLGQLYLGNVVGTFTDGETVSSTNTSGTLETIVSQSVKQKYNAAHHYENADKEYVDIDPTVGPGALLTEVTWLDRLNKQNDEQRAIRVIRPSEIRSVIRSFREAVRL